MFKDLDLANAGSIPMVAEIVPMMVSLNYSHSRLYSYGTGQAYTIPMDPW